MSVFLSFKKSRGGLMQPACKLRAELRVSCVYATLRAALRAALKLRYSCVTILELL